MRNDFETLLVKQEGPILHITINRPEARNAFTFKMHDEFEQIFDETDEDDEIKVLTVTGAGKIFSAGHDLKEVAEGYASVGEPSGWKKVRGNFVNRMWYYPKPIIVGVHGFVGPIAQDFIAHADFIIAAEGTKFSFEQARMGGGSPGATPLVFHFPIRVWKKLLMTGGWYTAEQALKWDFVQRVVPEAEVENEVRNWADQIAQVPTKQVQAAKTGIHRQYELMGFANMAGVQNRVSGHGSPEDMEFFRTVLDKGLKEAVKGRDLNFDESFSQI